MVVRALREGGRTPVVDLPRKRRTAATLVQEPPVALILGLQRSAGNAAVARKLAQRRASASEPRKPVAPALQRCGPVSCNCSDDERAAYAAAHGQDLGAVQDPLEQEAERVADQITSMPDPAKTGAHRHVDRVFATCGDGEQRQAHVSGPSQAVSGDAPAAVYEVLGTAGHPLDTATRGYFEPRFDHDFSNVRVHTDPSAEKSAQEVSAHAYTVQHDIVFGPDRYSPGTPEGRRLLAHELTHVVQQSGARQVNAERDDDVGARPAVFARSAEKRIMRAGFESTVQICHRVLESRNFTISRGGVRVVLLLKPQDTSVRDCRDFSFSVTLTRSKDWWPDDQIGTCSASTGGTRSFSFANLVTGTYYLTIARNFDHPGCCLDGDLLVFDEPVAGDSAGCTRDKDPSAMDIVHGALDLAGFIPVLGAIPDGINAGIYALEGDWANAGLSAVAAVPAWGDGVKLGTIAGKSSIKVSEKAAVRLGEEGIATGLKEVKSASRVEKAAAETGEGATKATKVEKGAADDAAKAEKEAAEKAGKSEKEAAERAARKDKCYAIYLEQTAYCGSTYTDDDMYELCMSNAWKNYIRCLNGLPPKPLNTPK